MLSQIVKTLVRHPKWVPERLGRCLSSVAADIVWFFHASNVIQLERNLSHVMEGASPREIRRASRQSLRSYFVYFFEALTMGARSEEEILHRLQPGGSGFPHPILDCFDKQSLPVAMGHQGNWDYLAFWACKTVGTVTTVAEKLADPNMLEAFLEIRRGMGVNILLTGQNGLLRDLTHTLEEPRQIVSLLADRDLGRNGVFVHAFDSMIRVAAGPAVLALDAHLPLYTVNIHRERIGREEQKLAHSPYKYVCQVDGPIDIEPYLRMPRQKAVQELTQAWVDQWSRAISAWPQDWHMMQPIFVEDLDMSRLHNVPQEVLSYIGERKKTSQMRKRDE